jgi:hypothetical protein
MIVCSTYWVPANNCMSFNCLIISVLLLKTPLSREGGVISIYWFHPAIVLYFSCARRVWRYKRGNQNQYIEEEQTTQWPKDTKGVIRISISKKNRQHNGQKIQKGNSESVYQRRTDNTMAKRYQRAIVLSVLLRYTDSDYPFGIFLAIVLSVLLRYTDSDYPFGIFWPLCCLFFFDILILINPFVSSNSSCTGEVQYYGGMKPINGYHSSFFW